MQQKDEIRSISIIGAGNVGWHLAGAFKQADYQIRLISRNSSDTDHLDYVPDLYLICTQDTEIEALAGSLSSSGAIVAHTSGGTGLEVFTEKQGRYGVFYPLQTFIKGQGMDYSTIPFLLEGSDPQTVTALQGLAERISGNFRIVDSLTRRKVHLAAVFACNFSNHMFAAASRILDDIDLDLEIIKPLIEQTFRKLDNISPTEAQTGPAVRGDETTMKRHMDLLRADPDLQELYQKISQNIIKDTDIDHNE